MENNSDTLLKKERKTGSSQPTYNRSFGAFVGQSKSDCLKHIFVESLHEFYKVFVQIFINGSFMDGTTFSEGRICY